MIKMTPETHVPSRPKGTHKNIFRGSDALIEKVSNRVEKEREGQKFEKRKGRKESEGTSHWMDESFMKKNDEYLAKMVERQREKSETWGPKFVQSGVGFGQDEEGFSVEYKNSKWHIDGKEVTIEEMLDAIGPNKERLMKADEKFKKLVDRSYH